MTYGGLSVGGCELLFETNEVFNLSTKMRCRAKFWNVCRTVSKVVKFFKPSKTFKRVFYKMWKDEWTLKKFKLNHDTPEDFTRSFWQMEERVVPTWFAYRLILTLYFIGTYAYMFLGLEHKNYGRMFIYATSWGYTVETSTFLLGFFIVIKLWVFTLAIWGFVNFKDCRGRRRPCYWELGTDIENQRELCTPSVLVLLSWVERFIKEIRNPDLESMQKMPFHYKIFWALYTTAASASLVVSFIFWLFIYNPDQQLNAIRALILHAFNSLVILFDFFLTGHPIQFLHFYFPTIFASIYAIFSVIYQFSGGEGPSERIILYKILDWTDADTAIESTIGCIVACVITHCFLSLISLLKLWLKRPSDLE